MATLLDKVSSISKPQVGTVAWLDRCIERSASSVFTEIVTVTPGLASVLLARNPDNRNMSPTKAAHYAADMISGRWSFNGEPVIISKDGLLNDGQHRMQAIIDANLSLQMIFVFGTDRESRTTIDQGKARSASCYLSMDGSPYAANAATAAKFIIAYERSNGRNISARSAVTNAEIIGRVKADEDIVKAAQFAHRHYKDYRHLFSHTVMTACYYIFAEISKSDAEFFLNQVAMGESIKRGDPAFAVRAAFLSEKRERQDAMEVIFHGWNKFRAGQSVKVIRLNGTLPALI